MSTEQQTISSIHTPCKECVFAKYEDNTQTDCLLDLINQYKESDSVEILEAYDDDKEFYIVNKKKCAGYKVDAYFTSRDLDDLSMEEKIEYVKDKLQLNYLLLINAVNTNPEDITKLLSKINDTNILPKKINVILSEDNPHSFNSYLVAIKASEIKSKWRITSLQDKEDKFITTLHRTISVDQEHNFILSVDGDSTNVEKILTTANDRVYKKFKRFIVIGNKTQNTMIFNKFVYKEAFNLGVDILINNQHYETI
jgi:hypothetical protein